MSRLLSFIFMAALTPLLPAFFFFIGIKVSYIDYYGIEEYFNVLFVDKISWLLYWELGLFFAFLSLFTPKRFAGFIYIMTVIASMSMFNDSIAREVAAKMFAKEHFLIKIKPWTYTGVLLYEGRYNYYLLNDENNRTMTLKKEKIDEAY